MSVLLRQAEGHQRLFRVSEGSHVNQPSIAEPGHVARSRLGFDPTALASVSQPPNQDHDITYGKKVIHLGAQELPRISKVSYVSAQPVVAVVHAFLAKLSKARVPLDFSIGQLDQTCDVLSGNRIYDRSTPLYVLLRHRPRSIPQAQESA